MWNAGTNEGHYCSFSKTTEFSVCALWLALYKVTPKRMATPTWLPLCINTLIGTCEQDALWREAVEAQGHGVS